MSFKKHVTITLDELIRQCACDEGIGLFKLLAPEGTWEGEWTVLHSLMIAANSGFLGWLEWHQVVPCLLAGADLCGADLCGAILRGVNLRGVNLRGADLSDADLYGANLRGANLRGANLCGVNLRDVNLRSADLRGADLRGAYLVGAILPEGFAGMSDRKNLDEPCQK